MLLCFQILFFSCQQVVGKELFLYVLESESCHGIREALARNALLTEEKDRFFYDCQYFVLVGEYFIKIPALGHFLAPASADVNAVAVCIVFHRVE